MSGMNTAADVIARRESNRALRSAVDVDIHVSWRGGLCLPDSASDMVESAEFKLLTFGDNFVIERACQYSETVDGHEKTSVDYNEMRRLSLKRCLVNWTLEIPIEREDGWLSPECYERVSKVPGPLIEAFLDGFFASTEITSDEEEKISRQSAVLFGKSSRGVMDACEAVRLYCTLGSFSEKFGMDMEQVMALPLRDYAMLRMMVGNENEAMRREHRHREPPTTKIAGRGGRTRSSRGQRIPM